MTESEDPWLVEQRRKAQVSGQPWMFYGAISATILLTMLTVVSDDSDGAALTAARIVIPLVFVAMVVVRFAVPVSRLSLRRSILRTLLAVLVTVGLLGVALVALG